jgi:hypothetical protein
LAAVKNAINIRTIQIFGENDDWKKEKYIVWKQFPKDWFYAD